ncbi:MAG: phytanoyl-CoA dioxygenase family protein [Candidatus Latescibacterota bacterium]|nr:phytanoyl-CoA dioxygenase family protein [Candidatus Latescibacterota bacterium]
MIAEAEKRDQLINEGFCVFEAILGADMVSRFARASNQLLDAQDPEHFELQKSTGSMVCVWDDPFFSELIGWGPALDSLSALGFDRPTFSTGFVISKPPGSPPLFWHQDWWGWNHPHSYTPEPQQIFFMYYLIDTTPENGCLRLIPGSHLKRHAMHDDFPEAHTDDIRRAKDLSNPVFLNQPDEVNVCVKAGDLVMGDSRLLHSARANTSGQRRTVITLWYHPIFYQLPESMQALLGSSEKGAAKRIEAWPEDAQSRVRNLISTYKGDAEPLVWNRTPGPQLKY